VSLPEFSPYSPSTLIARVPVAIDQMTLEIEAPDGALERFERPGQFVRVRVTTDEGTAHEGIFAMLSAPGEGALRFLIRTPNPEGGEAADRLAQLPIDSPLEVTFPTGEGFALDRARGRDLVFVATGTAIAPVRSAIEFVLARRRDFGALALHHGLRSPEHLAIAGDVERWRAAGVAVFLHYSEPQPDGTVRGVRVQDVAIAQPRDLARAAFVAVGQSAMVKELREMVAARNGDPSLVLHNY
jgi:ferredoxin-NADP reductase